MYPFRLNTYNVKNLWRTCLFSSLAILSSCSTEVEQYSSGFSVEHQNATTQIGKLDFSESLLSRSLPSEIISQVAPRFEVFINNSQESVAVLSNQISDNEWQVSFAVPPGESFSIDLTWVWVDLVTFAQLSQAFDGISANINRELVFIEQNYNLNFDNDGDGHTNFEELQAGSGSCDSFSVPNDDDDFVSCFVTSTDGDGTAGTATEGDTSGFTDDGTVVGPEYNANSTMGLIAADPLTSIFADALFPDFDQVLDTANQNWTVFAPTNDALAAAIAGGADVNVLQSHIYVQGPPLAAVDLLPGQLISMSNNSMYVITADDSGSLLINGIAIIAADLPADNGALHIIDGVLIPNN